MEVIKVIDLTETATHCEELLFLKIYDCSKDDILELFRIAFLLKRLQNRFPNRVFCLRERKSPFRLSALRTGAELPENGALRPAYSLFFFFLCPPLSDMKGGNCQTAYQEEAIKADAPA